MKKIFVLALMFIAPAALAYDETCGDGCADLPSCADLGYKQGLYCPEGYITCPFDQDYIWCKSYTCNMGGLYTRADSETKRANGYKCRKTTYHGLECYNCDELDKDLCHWTDENKGEGELAGMECDDGSWTDCIRKCAEKDKSAEIPNQDGVIQIKETCVSCGIPEVIVVGFRCATGFIQTETGCEASGCPVPTSSPEFTYETSGRTDCSDKEHPESWIFEANGESAGVACTRCFPRPCNDSTYTAGLNSCPNETGYNYSTMGYSGDLVCGLCEALRCNAPYSTDYQSISDCPSATLEGWSREKAWTFEQDTTGAGDLLCGRCVPKTCAGGYSESIQSLSDCPNQTGYTFSYDTAIYHGNQYCGKCEASGSCTEGQTGLTALSQCTSSPYNYPGTKGASIQETGYYNGSEACKKCVCNPTSDCQWTSGTEGAHPIGTGGIGSGICCDGSYTNCQNSTCTGVKNVSGIDHATATTICSACGDTYTTVTDCEEGYKKNSDGTACVAKDCADYGLNEGNCSAGFKPVESQEHSGCYSCEAKTCPDINSDWMLYSNGVTCEEGYKLTQHTNQQLGNSTGICYDCLSCQTYPNYITVNSADEIPSYVTSYDLKKSCDKYQYCATDCASGYNKSGCQCVSATCEGYVEKNGLTKINDDLYTDGIFTYSVCNRAGQLVFKTNGCADEYPFSSCDTSIGEQSAGGGSQDGYNCYKCECTGATPTLCPYTTNQSDTTRQYVGSGTPSNQCCDGSYKNCTKGSACSGFTLTSIPEHAAETQSCTACGQTKYKVTRCETGYTGTDCSDCDEENGYYECGGVCVLRPECENGGTPECVNGEWKCDCPEGYTGDDCSECDTANGYYKCGGVCKYRCAYNPQCVNGEWECECPEGYTGDDCSECDTANGYQLCGGTCQKINCQNGGTARCSNGNMVCDCTCCYEGTTCGTLSNRCTTGGVANTCDSNATGNSYSSSCNQNCYTCSNVSVPTCQNGSASTLDCYNTTAKGCSSFCGRKSKTSSTTSLVTSGTNLQYCSMPPTVQGSYIYSWLTDTSSSVSISNGCGQTCYFDDTQCSAGTKMTASEREGLSCEVAGYTAAGTACYTCTELDDECGTGLIREENISSYGACSHISTTDAGTKCYECCPSGYSMLSSDTTCNSSISASLVARSSNDEHCCYNLDGCGDLGCNTTYTSETSCNNAVRVGSTVIGSCAPCRSDDTIKWYPSCSSSYSSRPTPSSYRSDAYYTCCFEQSGGTLSCPSGSVSYCLQWKLNASNQYTCSPSQSTFTCTDTNISSLEYNDIYSWNEIKEVSLGSQTCADTCYVGKDCSPVATSNCVGLTCDEVTCGSQYRYDASDASANNAELSGSSCTPVDEDCDTGYTKYSGLSCNTTTYPYYTGHLPAHGTLTGISNSLCCTDSSNVKYCSDFNCTTNWHKTTDGTACECDASINVCSTGTYLDCSAVGMVVNGTAYTNSCGNPCYTCKTECTYQYRQGVDPVKDGSASCVRDGVTYYKEICEGSTTRTPCGGSSTKYYADVCYTYNGIPYYSGACLDMPTIQASAYYPSISYANLSSIYVSNQVRVFRTASTTGTMVLGTTLSGNWTNAGMSLSENLGGVMPGTYYVYVSDTDWDHSMASIAPSGFSCGIQAIVINGRCYVNSGSNALQYVPACQSGELLTLPDLAVNPIPINVTTSSNNQIYIYSPCGSVI